MSRKWSFANAWRHVRRPIASKRAGRAHLALDPTALPRFIEEIQSRREDPERPRA